MRPARYSAPARMFAPTLWQPPSASARSWMPAEVSCIGPTPWQPRPWRRNARYLRVQLRRDREQAARRALDRVADVVVAEDVLEAALGLEHGAEQRDRQAGALGLEHDLGLVVGAGLAQRGLQERVGIGFRIRRDRRVREVMAQIARVGGAVRARLVALGVGQRRRRAGDRAKRSHAALGLEPEHAADAPEREVRVAVPEAVDREGGRRAELGQMAVEVALEGRDPGAGPLVRADRVTADDGAPGLKWCRSHVDARVNRHRADVFLGVPWSGARGEHHEVAVRVLDVGDPLAPRHVLRRGDDGAARARRPRRRRRRRGTARSGDRRRDAAGGRGSARRASRRCRARSPRSAA